MEFIIKKEIVNANEIYLSFLLDNRYKSILAITDKDFDINEIDSFISSICVCINSCLREKSKETLNV